MKWIKAVAEKKLEEKGSLIFRYEGHQIALFWVEGRGYAVDNRCPHEGYPLKEGTVDAKRCVLTCQWHNWKFDLKTGATLRGEDHVRVYPVEIRDGWIWLNMSPPAQEKVREGAMQGLSQAFEKRQYGRMVREVTRMIAADIDPVEAINWGIRQTYNRFEYGQTHAFAVAADWLALAEQDLIGVEQQAMCFAEALDHMADDALRQAEFGYTARVLDFNGTAFVAAIEEEDEDKAVALFRGALAQGLAWSDLRYWFAKSALDHYKGFGHALIYVYKLGSLLKRVGEQQLLFLGLPLVRYLIQASREDLIPQFRHYGKILTSLREEKATFTGKKVVSDRMQDVFGLPLNRALLWVQDRFADSEPAIIFDTLLAANARNMLQFDSALQEAFDRPVSQSISWLDFTHALTFANAVRRLCHDYPDLWMPALLQMACFAGRNQPFLLDESQMARWQVEDADDFFKHAKIKILDHGLMEPIFSCHLLKTTLAVEEEAAAASPATALLLTAGLNRFLNAPLKQKHVRRLARQARTLLQAP